MSYSGPTLSRTLCLLLIYAQKLLQSDFICCANLCSKCRLGFLTSFLLCLVPLCKLHNRYPFMYVYKPISSSSSSLGSRCVPWLGKGLSLSSPNYPVLCCPPSYRVAPVFVQVVSPPLGWSPLSYFLVIWSPSGDTRGPSVVFEAVDMPCPGPFHFSHSLDYIYEFCPLSDPDVDISIFVCDVEHTSFHVGSVRPQVCSVLIWSVSRSLNHMS